MHHQDKSVTHKPFFRSEAIEANSASRFGTIRLSRPISAWLTSGIALFIVTVFLGYVSNGSITRKSRVSGVTVPVGGNMAVFAPSTGVVLRFLVSEGEQVNAGQRLFELSTEKQGERGEITALAAKQIINRENSLEEESILRTWANKEKYNALQQKIGSLVSTVEQVEQEIILAERRIKFSKTNLSKYESWKKRWGKNKTH